MLILNICFDLFTLFLTSGQNIDMRHRDIYDNGPTMEQLNYARDLFGEGIEDFIQPKREAEEKVELHEPAVLHTNFITEEDTRIKNVDIPERLQLLFGDEEATEDELREEAQWIYSSLLLKTKTRESLLFDMKEKNRSKEDFESDIFQVLKLIRISHIEAPNICLYYADSIGSLNEDDIWNIAQFNEKW